MVQELTSQVSDVYTWSISVAEWSGGIYNLG